MLDDSNVVKQRDPSDALGVCARQYEQARYDATVMHAENDGRQITTIVVTGMGGSALAALLLKSWLREHLRVPLEIVRTYDLPEYVGYNTLVIASSYSGNTEETVHCLDQALHKGAQVGVVASGGRLLELANEHAIVSVGIPAGIQPRMSVINDLRAVTRLLVHFGVLEAHYYDDIAIHADWLREESARWAPSVGLHDNYAKQIALTAVGKTPVFYASSAMSPVAYKWKISWNENAKNVSFWNEYPEFNHNEFLGWSSHPIEKPFAVFDIHSSLDHPQITKRFEVSDRLLSGRRPKATPIVLSGTTLLAQMLWGSILADYASVYTAIMNGVDPTPVDLIEKLKRELVS